jgi:hypothetical protein
MRHRLRDLSVAILTVLLALSNIAEAAKKPPEVATKGTPPEVALRAYVERVRAPQRPKCALLARYGVRKEDWCGSEPMPRRRGCTTWFRLW